MFEKNTEHIYILQMGGGWNDVKVIVKRPDGDRVDPDGPCANSAPEDDIKTVSLPSGTCLKFF